MKTILNGAFSMLALSALLAVGTVVVAQDTPPPPAPDNTQDKMSVKRYEGRVKDSGILLSVHSDTSDEIKRAKEILERTGAQDISSTGESRGDKSATPSRNVA